MNFKVGDTVVHPTQGVGHIVKIEKRQFLGNDANLYYEIAIQNGSIWIPVDYAEVANLRIITSKSELERYRQVLTDPPASLDNNYRVRRAELANRVRQGSFEEICALVRDLNAFSWEKPLSDTDNTMFQQLKTNLCSEWAETKGVTVEEALKEIDTLLNVCIKKYHK